MVRLRDAKKRADGENKLNRLQTEVRNLQLGKIHIGRMEREVE
jgi:hypothetical protein